MSAFHIIVYVLVMERTLTQLGSRGREDWTGQGEAGWGRACIIASKGCGQEGAPGAPQHNSHIFFNITLMSSLTTLSSLSSADHSLVPVLEIVFWILESLFIERASLTYFQHCIGVSAWPNFSISSRCCQNHRTYFQHCHFDFQYCHCFSIAHLPG